LSKYIALHDGQVAGHGGYQETLDSLQSMYKAVNYISARFKGRSSKIDELIKRLESLTFKQEVQEGKPSIDDDIPF